MRSIRHETYDAGGALIGGLWRSGQIAQMLHDGGDIILFETPTGDSVSIHLIESGIEPYEIRKIVQENSDQGVYTLFMLWAAMMLPLDGGVYEMSDWMRVFLALHDARIYGYEVLSDEMVLFPVWFHPQDGVTFIAEYGARLDLARLVCTVRTPPLLGFDSAWRIADFSGVAIPPPSMPSAAPLDTLAACYALLGVSFNADRETIKQAYRTLARRWHPDANAASDATVHMQQLNQAYRQILVALDAKPNAK